MIVALAAAQGRPQPGHAHSANTIGRISGQVLFRLSPAFARHHVQSIKARGDQLFGRRVTAGRRQQIAGQLFERELIERLVSVERIDHVVAIGEDALVLVTVVADRVRKPDDV